MIMINLKPLRLLFILLLPSLLYAQPYYFNHYQINEGLSNNAVICSMQDSQGFLWFGTKDGLNRFDGNNFKHFDATQSGKNSLGGNNIISLKEDFRKRIWIGTDQGIYCYDPVDEQFRLLSKQFENADVPVIVPINAKGSGLYPMECSIAMIWLVTQFNNLQNRTSILRLSAAQKMELYFLELLKVRSSR